MKKAMTIVIILVMIICNIAVIVTGNSFENSGTSSSKDQHIETIDTAYLIENKNLNEIKLPNHIDVNGETTLQINLNYQFESGTIPVLMMKANHCYVSFSMNDEIIYEVEKQNISAGNYFVMVPLPEKSSNEILQIKIYVLDNCIDRIKIPKMYIGDISTLTMKLIENDLISLYLNAFIMFCGFLFIVVSIIERKSVDMYTSLTSTAFLFICCTYFTCETNSVCFLVANTRMIYLLDLLSLSLLGPPLLMVFAWNVTGVFRKIFNGIAIIGIMNTIIQLIFACTNIIEIRLLLPVTSTIQIIGILLCLVYIVSSFVNHTENPKIIIFGMLIAIAAITDIVLFNLEKSNINPYFTRIILMVYFIYKLVLLIYSQVEQNIERRKAEYYKEMAIYDSLTGCFSRAEFYTDIEAWDGVTKRTAFMMDLNDLKAVNDKYGHSMGDKYIITFSDLIKKNFAGTGKCYRVGGDEFYVFCDNITKETAIKLAESLRALSLSANQIFDVKFGLGFCDTDETEGNLEEAIKLADKRMYENKAMIKELDN